MLTHPNINFVEKKVTVGALLTAYRRPILKSLDSFLEVGYINIYSIYRGWLSYLVTIRSYRGWLMHSIVAFM